MKKNTLVILLLFALSLSSLAQSNSKKQTTTSAQTLACDNWLKTNAQFDAVQIGDLDITGNKLTVEAVFNRTAPYSGAYVYAGDIVSKHQDPTDCNYLLRPLSAEITTTNGYFITPLPPCALELNKTYHVAMVYDGTTLKFYRNGFLVTQVAATGNLIQNNHITTIGDFAPFLPGLPENLTGYINEVRIWNVARTQTQLQTYVNTSLPSPTTQTGLLAYYVFDNLLNKQGNPAWNGIIKGNATINATNTACNNFPLVNCVTTPPQFCTGSLGAPVVQVDFGSGSNPAAPLSSIVSGASTTHTYVSVTGNPATPTPIDGEYTITNNIPNNSAWFSGQSDHTSGDTNGYMAFYNSQQTAGQEFYKQVITNLCGETTYEFSAWVANCLNPAVLNGVDPDLTFRIEKTDGTLLALYNTGPIAETATFTWNRFGLFFTTGISEATVVVKIINNSVGGNAQPGNDLALDDISFRPCGPTIKSSLNASAQIDSFSVCEGSAVTLYGSLLSTGYNSPSYLWQVSTDNAVTWTTIPNSNAIQINYTMPIAGINKTYKFRLLYANGSNINSPSCRVITNLLTVTSTALPSGNLAVETVCPGQKPNITFTSTSASSPFSIVYNVNGKNYTQSNLSNNTSFLCAEAVNNNSSITLVSITDTRNCLNTINNNVSITFKALPQGGITDAEGCEGDSSFLRFTATAGSAPFTIKITDGTTTYTISNLNNNDKFAIPNTTNTITKTYFITELKENNGNNCTRVSGFTNPSATLTVNKKPKSFFIPYTPICLIDTTITINQATEANGLAGAGFYWGKGVITPNLFNPMLAGAGKHFIKYEYITDKGCRSLDSEAITVNALPVINAGEDIERCGLSTVQLNATGANNYIWSPSSFLNNATISNPVATVSATTDFIVKGTDNNGCYAKDTMKFIISDNIAQKLFVANTFTPNGDGVNDCFGISHWGFVELTEFSIYNRWGQKIFSSNDSQKCWDGTFNGLQQTPGVYIYQIRAINGCGEINRRGFINLLR